MASVCVPPRQLAPTVGLAATPAGVFIRTGSFIASGERVVSGLVQRLGSLDFVSDNAGNFLNGPFPRNGLFVNFGQHRVFVGTVPVRVYPEVVRVAADPPAFRATSRSASSAEVLMVGTGTDLGKGAAAEPAVPAARPSRSSKPAYERQENITERAGTSTPPIPNVLQATIDRLATPVVPTTDFALTQAELEEQRQSVLREATEVARVRQEFDISLREYNMAHGFTPVSKEPSRMPDVRARGRILNEEIARDGSSDIPMSVSYMSADKPKYSSPAKNLRAARAAAAELSNLSGEALRKQQNRLQELLDIADKQNAEFAKANPGVGASQLVHSAGGAPGKSGGQASSPHVGKRRDGSVNSKQMTLYDPVVAGKRVAKQDNVVQGYVGHQNVGRKSQGAAQGNTGNPNAGNRSRGAVQRDDVQGNVGRDNPARHGANSAVRGQPPRRQGQNQSRQYQAGGQAQDQYDDGYTAMENAGYPGRRQQETESFLGPRLGQRHLPANDARHRLDRKWLSEMLEEQGPPGPECFGPRIMREPPLRNFQLPRGTRKYDGSTKPQDWLIDYATAVHVAGGNRRWAIRYVPQMLEGPARVWLNNMPPKSIDGWLDFEEAFNSNFISTYKRPNRPQQLSMCQQRTDETDREYLTRWSALRNSCEGVVESQAISWFAQGCRHGSMLWQRLQREMPVTMAETIRVADSYALGDPTQPTLKAEPTYKHQGQERRFERQDNRVNKRSNEQPDRRYGANHVATVGEHPDAGSSQRQKNDGKKFGNQKKPWDAGQKKAWQERPKYTMEMMLDGPCSFHTPDPRKPANHTSRHCSWMNRILQGNVGLPPAPRGLPPPPPLSGANTQAMPHQPAYAANRDQPAAIHQVNNNPNVGRGQANNSNSNAGPSQGRNNYREHHQSYVVFVTEPTDKQSQHRRAMEVNAVMPAVPQYMYWSEQEIRWSRADHPRVMPNPGGYALVVDPTFIGPDINVRFSKVLVDNGSSINIMYRDTMVKLGVTENMLEPSRTTFHGIVPGLSCSPMGKVRVDVLLGTKENCRVENLLFEVVDLVSPYHALLGRPALAKFMASTHVGYLKMKLPGPNGIITIVGNYKRSMECASAGSNLAESLVIAEEKKRMQVAVALAQSAQLGMPGLSNPQGGATFKPSNETKAIQIDEQNPERTLLIGAGLAEK